MNVDSETVKILERIEQRARVCKTECGVRLNEVERNVLFELSTYAAYGSARHQFPRRFVMLWIEEARANLAGQIAAKLTGEYPGGWRTL